MPPIPIYTQSPITAAKASGVTPQTSGDTEEPSAARQPPTITAALPHSGYPPAQPGAVPSLPAPTGSSQSRYAPVQPTPTRKSVDYGPPPPQPGAVPTPPGARTTLPPPPRAGETYHAPQETAAPGAHWPAQMGIPPPTVPYPGPRGTSTATTRHLNYAPPTSQPVRIRSSSQSSLEHPPGYQQDSHAYDLDSNPRPVYHTSGSAEPRRSSSSWDEGEEGVWESAKKLVQHAGEKLSEAESEIWRRINKD